MLEFERFVLLLVVAANGNTAKHTKGTVSVIFGGDVDFSRLTRYLHQKKNCSYLESLRRLKRTLTSADFSMINLETTIGRPANVGSKVNDNTKTGLWSEISALTALTQAGVRYVSLANNHMQDFRDKQINKTTEYLRLYGIRYSGIVYGSDVYAKQKPLIMKKNGVKIGILSYCDLNTCTRTWTGMKVGPAILKVEKVAEEVKSLKSKAKCDIVVLFLHWGVEYGSITDTGVIGIVKNLTKSVHIDLIVGSHPHVTQKHWYTGKTLVATSLGNLFFMPYNLANFNFNEDAPPGHRPQRNGTHGYFERVWYRQMKVMQDGTNLGRLLKVVFDKNGIVTDKSKYITTQICATNNHCLATKIEDDSRWQTICGVDDRECTGTSDCNYVECGEDEPLPAHLPSSPRKGGQSTSSEQKKGQQNKQSTSKT